MQSGGGTERDKQSGPTRLARHREWPVGSDWPASRATFGTAGNAPGMPLPTINANDDGPMIGPMRADNQVFN